MVYSRARTEFGGLIDFDRMVTERREKAKKAMAKYELDAVLLFRHENCKYVVGTWPRSSFEYVLYPINAEVPIHHWVGMNVKNLLEAKIRGVNAKYTITIPDFVKYSNLNAFNFQVGKFVKQIKGELAEYGIPNARIGIDGSDPAVIEALRKEGINISTEGQRAMCEARLIKTRDEVECLRMACAIAEGCFERACEVIKPGITEEQIYAEIQKKAFDLGATSWDGGIVLSGPHSFPPSASVTDRIVRPGDIVLIDINKLSYHGYMTCYYRNFSVGEPTKTQEEAWAKAREFTYDSIKMIKPGVSTADLVRTWPKAEDYGFENEDAACFCQWAHGLGLTHYEAPIFSRIWSIEYPEEIKENMVFSVETLWPTNEKSGAYPLGQCLRIEEEVHVTSDGCEVISQWPIDKITRAW